MAGECVYEEKTVIHELTQGLHLAQQLRLNLHSPKTREFLIQRILSTYDNALFILKSGNSAGQPVAGCPAPTLPESAGSSPAGLHHHHQLSPPNPDEMLSNLRANLSVDTSDLGGDTVPSPFSFPSTSSGHMEEFHFPDYYDDELWQVCSPFISPATSQSNFFTEW